MPRRRGAVVVSRPSRSGLLGLAGVYGERETARGCAGLGGYAYGQGAGSLGICVALWAGRRWRPGVLSSAWASVRHSGRQALADAQWSRGSGRQLWAAAGETARTTSTNAVLLLDDWPVRSGGPGRTVRFGIRSAGNVFQRPVISVRGWTKGKDHQESRTPRFSFHCN